MSKFTDTTKGTPPVSARVKRSRTLWIAAAAVLLAVCLLLCVLSTRKDGRIYPVYITEVLASNTAFPNGDGRCCDYIELYNSADYPIDLTGFQLGDIAGSSRYAFPYGTVIEAGGYLVVYCDKTVEEAGYAPFGVSRSGGESFYLIASNGAIVDSMTTLPTDLDQAMVLLDSGEWSLTDTATPGLANSAAEAGQDIYNSGVSPVRITEFSAAGNGYAAEWGLHCDWVELYNTSSAAVDISGFILTDNVGNDKFRFGQGTQIPAGGYLVVYCADGATQAGVAPFGLSQLGGETVVLKNDKGMIVEIVTSLPSDGAGSMALNADGSWSLTSQPSPGFANTDEGYAAFLETIGAETGTILITELMAATQYVLADGYGEFTDWAELYNTGDRAVDLSGWFLSDDPAQPLKWQIPAGIIQPGQRLIVFLSGRGVDLDGELHADFSLSAGGESLVLSSYLGTQVDAVTFGASDTNCAYVFDTGSSPALSAAPTPGYPNDQDGYEAFCADSLPAGPLAIWEVMTSNDWYLPQALGECYDWVEIRNISDQSVQLSDYCISDDADIPGMYRLPDQALAPGQSVVIILSGDAGLSTNRYAHAGFSLDAKEDQLFLYGTDGTLLDYVYLKEIPLQHSYGRQEGVGGFYYMNPTPGSANGSGYLQISAAPASEIAPGVYTADTGFTVPLTSEGTIYYTLDGSDPDLRSQVYSGPIQIDETTVLRAVSQEEGKMLSSIYTATFIIQEPHSIPVVSLVTDPDNLWGPNGIYKSGDIDIKEEKRSANLSYTGPDGSFSLDCEISLHGATTVTAFEKKSFSVRFQDNYDGPLYYDVFEDGEVTSFSSLIVRAAHESTFSTHLRDALMGQVAADNCDTLISQKHKYVALYINGEYWGLYALRELHSNEHYANYMNVPADTVSRVRYCTDEPNSLSDLYKSLDDISLRVPSNYEYAKSILDMSSFADWIIFQSYVGNLDIHGNMRYYYSTADGLWRCGLVDVDLGMFGKSAFNEIADTFHHGKLVTALLQNEEFQDLIARRLAELLEGPLSDEAMLANVAQMCDTIRDEIPLEGKRWGYDTAIWERFVSEVTKYCDGRAEYMIHNFCTQVGFTAAEKEEYFGHLLK